MNECRATELSAVVCRRDGAAPEVTRRQPYSASWKIGSDRTMSTHRNVSKRWRKFHHTNHPKLQSLQDERETHTEHQEHENVYQICQRRTSSNHMNSEVYSCPPLSSLYLSLHVINMRSAALIFTIASFLIAR